MPDDPVLLHTQNIVTVTSIKCLLVCGFTCVLQDDRRTGSMLISICVSLTTRRISSVHSLDRDWNHRSETLHVSLFSTVLTSIILYPDSQSVTKLIILCLLVLASSLKNESLLLIWVSCEVRLKNNWQQCLFLIITEKVSYQCTNYVGWLILWIHVCLTLVMYFFFKQLITFPSSSVSPCLAWFLIMSVQNLVMSSLQAFANVGLIL